ncbi:MAG: thiol-activated cytolysin family protein [Myxococcales bacterium]|nr:thiol-activated cytolysin family protein [Myxococcales bacterium]
MRTLQLSLPFVALGLLAVGCAAGELTGSGDGPLGEGHQAIDAYVDGLPDLPLAPPMPKSEVECSGDDCPVNGQEGEVFCTYKHYAEVAHYEKFVAFQPNSATLWPGVVVKGLDAAEGMLTPVGVELAPVTFSVSLENIANSPVGYMDLPSLSAFRDARNAILGGGVTGATPASLDFDILEVHSESQIAVALGAGLNWPGGAEIAGSFNFSSSAKKTKILVNFTQAYYTIDVDAPTTPKDFFTDDVTVDDLLPYTGNDNPPLYVQSITFGRRVLFSIESDETASAVKAALEATYKGAVDVTASVSVEQKTTLASSTIKAFVLGGSGGEATGAVSGVEGLMGYIKNGGNYSQESPGAPIAYKLAYLDNTATKLAFTTEYSERECHQNVGNLRATLKSIDHVDGADVGSNIELSGYVGIRYPTVATGVVSCDAGGEEAAIWYLADGQWVDVPEYSTWVPSAPTFVDLEDVAFGAGQAMCLIADIWDEDTSSNELTADDWYGTTGQLVLYENGWEGLHTLHLTGEGQNSVDVAVELTLQ